MIIDNRLRIVCVNGADSIYLLLTILEDALVDRSKIVVLMALDGNHSAELQRFYENRLFPFILEKQIRTVQIGRATNQNSDGLIVHDDTYSPQKYYGSECFSLKESLLTFGMRLPGPAYLYKFRGWLIRRWILDTFAGEDPHVLLGLRRNELKRLEKTNDLGGLRADDFWTLVLPLAAADIGPEQVCSMVTNYFGTLPAIISIIPNGHQKLAAIQAYYDNFPERASTALLVEYVGVALNARQKGWRGLKNGSLRESLKDDWRVEAFFQDYLRSFPWCLYQVKLLRGKKTTRSITKGPRGTHDFCFEYLMMLGEEKAEHRAALLSGDGIWRLWFVRNREAEHFLVALPNILEGSEPRDFQLNWQKYIAESFE